MDNLFQKASRNQKKLRLLLRGPSGSGKTYSALLLAKELSEGGKIALADTEKLSSTHYEDLVDFDVLDFNKQYEDHSPTNYINLINMAEKSGYKVLIIDSLSHSWIGDGGILDINNKIAEARFRNNTFAAWSVTTPDYYNPLVEKLIVDNNIHIIATGRTKTEYEVNKDSQGKMEVSKLGTKTQQREGLDYEFDVVLDLKHGSEGLCTPDKDRTRLFSNDGEQISSKTGKMLSKYLNSAKELRTIAEVKKQIKKVETIEGLGVIYKINDHLHDNPKFNEALAKHQEKLDIKDKSND